MNNLDVDDTVEFVWDWVAQMNAHLGVNGWTHEDLGMHHRGISPSALNILADHLFKMIVDAKNPHIVMKALTIQIHALTNNMCKYNVPSAYLFTTKTNEQTQVQWKSESFCWALDEDVAQLLQTFNACAVLGEKHMSNAHKMKQ